ncbi:MAG TPA: glycerol-3-phosphate acyltransferase [Oscillatoriaceae cyanobacterium M33_DOE_052]|uniref:Pyruvate phosphate dikinase PEP/pyruvate-binding protein n=1 Tax=Planktothricoides sp. SpSt-374 TaxID=2282167 RepID=A0A7C3VU85_9CYAN|nr:glycerol-3-phosphate acyltransferase [Oscillatoriaceae cyanobacterium M33_DOE_052]
MDMTQVWGAVLIFTVCPLLGGLPFVALVLRILTKRDLRELGTGNIGVQAAFYHGGRLAGTVAVLLEALKGIAAVLLARYFFPHNPEWELISLCTLVMGRYWMGQGAGTTNVVWGFFVHDWGAGLMILLIGGVSFTIWRERRQGRTAVLVLMPLILGLLHPHQPERLIVAMALSLLLYWIYQKMPDDLELSAAGSKAETQKLFRFFQGRGVTLILDQPLEVRKVGAKAATLSELKRSGYPVPPGWVLRAGDDPQPLLELLQPSGESPLVVRSSSLSEDLETASGAGQYASVLNVTSRDELMRAISHCFESYFRPAAQQYRRDRHIPEASALALLIQIQIRGAFSGVAFSRDPLHQNPEAVIIEALPGDAAPVVSGQVTPERYRVTLENPPLIEGKGRVPPEVLEEVAILARQLEQRGGGIPQDIEWSYDGQQLWLLQARPITTMLPIWTRRIAAEVIPGFIPPLTWSINRPLTCGVWGSLFTLVLGKGARGLDFEETATLHYSRAYFNASLLGQIFRRMGLPPESLEFLTRGAAFTKPPLASTLRSLPGLLRLLRRELYLERDFYYTYRYDLAPALAQLRATSPPSPSQPGRGASGEVEKGGETVSPEALLARVEQILVLLEKCTYYSILAPLSVALRQALLGVADEELDFSRNPEVAATRSLQEIVNAARLLLPALQDLRPDLGPGDSSQLFATLAEIPEGQMVFQEFDRFLLRYGYLSAAATDIAVPRWQEDLRYLRSLFAQMLFAPPPPSATNENRRTVKSAKLSPPRVIPVQHRVNLKGRVAEIYSSLLAQLRWSFLALENLWLQSGLLAAPGDIFYLELSEIRAIVASHVSELQGDGDNFRKLIESRKQQLQTDAASEFLPPVVYGQPPRHISTYQTPAKSQLRGIGASPGVVEGRVKIVNQLGEVGDIDKETILVVPYTDPGWAPLLSRAGGLISEVGGQLSHGAIVAREYRIPAVMDVPQARQWLREGQRVRLDGGQGTIDIL